MASIFYEIKKTIALFFNCNITCLQQSLAYIFSVLQRAGVRHIEIREPQMPHGRELKFQRFLIRTDSGTDTSMY